MKCSENVTIQRDLDDTRTFKFWMIFDEKSMKKGAKI